MSVQPVVEFLLRFQDGAVSLLDVEPDETFEAALADYLESSDHAAADLVSATAVGSHDRSAWAALLEGQGPGREDSDYER